MLLNKRIPLYFILNQAKRAKSVSQPSVKENEITTGLIRIIGGVYDVEAGLVTFRQIENSLQQTQKGICELNEESG